MKLLASPKLLLVFAILAASLSVNLILGLAAVRYYMLLNQTRLDPLGLQNLTSEDHPNENLPIDALRQPATHRVVFIGDSRAGAWPIPLGIESTEFINHGKSGHTTAQTLGGFQQHVADLEPDLVLIQAGINDLKTIPLFPDRKTEIIAQCKANIQKLTSRSADTGAKVVVTTIIPAGARIPLQRIPFWPREVDEAVDACNAGIRTLAADRVVVVDTASIVSQPNGRVKPQFQSDFLHLNTKGYEVLNRKLTPELIALLE